MNVSVIGLGKLGSPLAATIAARGHTVVGVDVDPNSVALINQGLPPVSEPGLEDQLIQARDRLSATIDLADAVSKTDMTLIIVPTPSGPDGAFSMEYVEQVIEAIGKALRSKSEFHLVVVTSTVMPGSTSEVVVPLLERASGKRVGVDIGLCYNPEFIALGSVVKDLLNPDFILIGQSDDRSGDLLESFYLEFCLNSPRAARMGFTNAELTKLAVNTFVTTKISYANMLTQICEQIDGANVDVVTSALGLDTRIGSKYLKGGLGYGGPCFPRDNIALATFAKSVGADATLAEATDAVNRLQVPRVAELALRYHESGGRVGILGLAYKPDSEVLEEAQGLQIAQAISNLGIAVTVHDPMALQGARDRLNGDILFASSISECIENSQVILITTPWQEYKAIDPTLFASLSEPAVVIDCWRLYEEGSMPSDVLYVQLGREPGSRSGLQS